MTDRQQDAASVVDTKSTGAFQDSVLVQLLQFAVSNKKWWLLPFVIVVAVLSTFVVLAGSGAAPLVYTLF